MGDWECGVCSYVHKEGKSPEACPVCEAPKKMFFKQGEKKQSEGGGADAAKEAKQWQCTVCGYIHTGTEPPEKCPICEATADMFEEMAEEEKVVEPTNTAERRWQCTVCGYIHTGEEPPEKCPVCDAPKEMFVEIDAEGKAIGEPPVEDSAPGAPSLSGKSERPEMSFFNRLGDLSLKFHLHPITVHFPNGVLPAVVLFLGLSVYFKIVTLETAAYFNLVFVLVMLPVVLLTGYIEWQKRYKGIKTAIFIIKIICSLVVLALVNVLVFWRLLDPGVMAEGSPSRFIYLGVAVVMLGAVGIAGHLGGKLVFGSRGD